MYIVVKYATAWLSSCLQFQSFGELRNLSKNDLAPSNFEFDGISPGLNTICGKDLKYNNFNFHDVTGSSLSVCKFVDENHYWQDRTSQTGKLKLKRESRKRERGHHVNSWPQKREAGE